MSARRSMRGLAGYTVSATLVTIMAVLILAPLVMLVFLAFTSAPPFMLVDIQFTLANFVDIWTPQLSKAIANTLVISAGGTAIAMVFGCGLAWLAARSDIPFKPFVNFAGVMPVFVSLLIAAITWSLLGAGRTGYLNIVLADLGLPFRIEMQSLAGIAFVSGLYYAPYPFIFLHNALSLTHPDLEEAAAVHGAGMGAMLRKITFPMVQPALIGSMLLIFVLIAEEFPVPEILGGPVGLETVSMRIYGLMSRSPAQPNAASAISLVFTLLVFMLVYAQRRILVGRDFRTVTGKGLQLRSIPLGRWKIPALVFVGVYAFVAMVLPLFALVQGAMRSSMFIPSAASLFDPAQFTLDHIFQAATDPAVRHALGNSLLAAGLTALLGSTFYFVISYVVARTKLPGRTVLDYAAMIPLSVPALVLALGIVWVWLRAPVPIYGTIAILVLAFITRFMPQGYRTISGSMVQLHDDLEDAALMSGATRVQAVSRITLPLLRGAVLSSGVLLIVLGVRELTASLFLYTTQTRVLSIVIFEQTQDGVWTSVASISLLYTALLVLLTVIARRWISAHL